MPPKKQQPSKRAREDDEVALPSPSSALPGAPVSPGNSLDSKELVAKASVLIEKLKRRVMQTRDMENNVVGLCVKYHDELTTLRDKVNNKFKLAFMGQTGVGKTTAICKLFDLMTPNDEPVLYTSTDHSTMCEVHIPLNSVAVPQYTLTVTPHKDPRSLIRAFLDDGTSDILSETPISALSIEETATIENILGGEQKIQEMRNACRGDKEKLLQLALEQARLDTRTATTFRPSSSTKDPRGWLREKFSNINSGQQPDVTIPHLIEITHALSDAWCSDIEEIIDTRGMSITDDSGGEENTIREDLERALEDPYTICIFCAKWGDAPGPQIASFLRRAKARERIDMTSLSSRILVLVLPRGVGKENGEEWSAPMGTTKAKITQESEIPKVYEHKASSIQKKLSTLHFGPRDLGGSSIQVDFFNVRLAQNKKLYARKTVLERARDSIQELIARTRENDVKILSRCIDDVEQFLLPSDEEVKVAVHRRRERLQRAIGESPIQFPVGNVGQTAMQGFLHQIEHRHFASFKATMRRNGDYPKWPLWTNIKECIRIFMKKVSDDTLKVYCDKVCCDEFSAKRRLGNLRQGHCEHITTPQEIAICNKVLDVIQDKIDLMDTIRPGSVADRCEETYFRVLFDQAFFQQIQESWGTGTGAVLKCRNLVQEKIASIYPKIEDFLRTELNQHWAMIRGVVEAMLKNDIPTVSGVAWADTQQSVYGDALGDDEVLLDDVLPRDQPQCPPGYNYVCPGCHTMLEGHFPRRILDCRHVVCYNCLPRPRLRFRFISCSPLCCPYPKCGQEMRAEEPIPGCGSEDGGGKGFTIWCETCFWCGDSYSAPTHKCTGGQP